MVIENFAENEYLAPVLRIKLLENGRYLVKAFLGYHHCLDVPIFPNGEFEVKAVRMEDMLTTVTLNQSFNEGEIEILYQGDWENLPILQIENDRADYWVRARTDHDNEHPDLRVMQKHYRD